MPEEGKDRTLGHIMVDALNKAERTGRSGTIQLGTLGMFGQVHEMKVAVLDYRDTSIIFGIVESGSQKYFYVGGDEFKLHEVINLVQQKDWAFTMGGFGLDGQGNLRAREGVSQVWIPITLTVPE